MPSGDVANPLLLFPRPPAQAQTSLLDDPSKVVGLVNSLTQLQGNQQALAARQATGAAYADALNDDGSIDQGKLAASLRANPAAAYSLPETTDRMLAQTQGQTDLDAKRNQFLVDAIGSTADDPKLDIDKVRSLAVTMARNLKIPAPMLNNWLDTLPKSKDGLRDKLIQFRNVATGSANLSTPTPTGFTPEGAPITASRGGFNYAATGTGVQSGLAPGRVWSIGIFCGTCRCIAGDRFDFAAVSGGPCKPQINVEGARYRRADRQIREGFRPGCPALWLAFDAYA